MAAKRQIALLLEQHGAESHRVRARENDEIEILERTQARRQGAPVGQRLDFDAGRRKVLAPRVSSRRHSGIACCWGRVTRTPTPCNGSIPSGRAQPLQQLAGAGGKHALGELLTEGLGRWRRCPRS